MYLERLICVSIYAQNSDRQYTNQARIKDVNAFNTVCGRLAADSVVHSPADNAVKELKVSYIVLM